MAQIRLKEDNACISNINYPVVFSLRWSLVCENPVL